MYESQDDISNSEFNLLEIKSCANTEPSYGLDSCAAVLSPPI